MQRSERNKAELLESLMEKHRDYELRTLADLRIAGFRFTSINAARQRLSYQRQMPGFTQAQIDIAIAALEKKRNAA